MAAYYFGVYHWRRRARSGVAAIWLFGLAVSLRRLRSSRLTSVLAAFLATGAAVQGVRVLSGLFSPPPWAIERCKYDALAAELPLEEAGHVLDVGCGTGRSLVGLAPHLPASATVLGLDVFDDRVILGNGPALARRNGRLAGIDITPIVGDATHLPVATDSQNVITACRVLHDLPPKAVDPALREARRACGPDGVLGILELPLTPTGIDRDPEAYWRERVLDAGFAIETLDRIDRRGHDEPYIVIGATPR